MPAAEEGERTALFPRASRQQRGRMRCGLERWRVQSHLERELDQVVLRLRAAADLAVLLAHQQHARREQAPLEHRQQPPSQLRGLHVERRKSRVNTQHGTGKRGDAREQSIVGRAGMGSLNDQRDEALGSRNLRWVAQISRGSHLQSRRQLEAVSGALCAQLLKACLCSRVCDRSFWRGQVRHVARAIRTNDERRERHAQRRRAPTQRARARVKCAPHFLSVSHSLSFGSTSKYCTILTQPQPHVLPQSLTGQGKLCGS